MDCTNVRFIPQRILRGLAQMNGENNIEKVRKGMREVFSEQNIVPVRTEEFVSPDGRYRIKQSVYKQPVEGRNWDISKIEVFDVENNLVASFLIDDDNFFHHWVLTDKKEYLLYAENLCGGNSVLNLKTREIQSFSDGTDGFIFAGYHPSPDLQYMAIVGCFWGAPYCVRVFDISNIESLPWPMILETELEDDEHDNIVWAEDGSVKIPRYLKVPAGHGDT